MTEARSNIFTLMYNSQLIVILNTWLIAQLVYIWGLLNYYIFEKPKNKIVKLGKEKLTNFSKRSLWNDLQTNRINGVKSNW